MTTHLLQSYAMNYEMVSLFGIAVLGKIWELNIKTHEISQENTCVGVCF